MLYVRTLYTEYKNQEGVINTISLRANTLSDAILTMDEWLKNPENQFDFNNYLACVAGIYYKVDIGLIPPNAITMSCFIRHTLQNKFGEKACSITCPINKDWPLVRKTLVETYNLEI